MNESSNVPNESDRWENEFRQWGKRPQPEPRPFFYTRLQARLNQSVESATWLPWWLRRPAYAYAALGLLVLLNMGAVISLTSTAPPADEAAPAITTLQDNYLVNDPVNDPVDDFTLAYE